MSTAARLAVCALLALAGCGSGKDDPPARFDPFTEVEDRPAETARPAAPRWERLATLSGSGPGREVFTVAKGAIQWRARWSCEQGALALSTRGGRLARARCPRRGTAGDVRTGQVALDVQATGRWRVVVEQQVDTPLREPLLAAMRAPGARVLARGRFYGIERRGRGTATLHRLASGRLALRLDGFETSANRDLFVWASTAARPRTTVEAARARHVVVRALKATRGAQNYLLPAGVGASGVRSVVIWCVPVRIAYTAAALRPR